MTIKINKTTLGIIALLVVFVTAASFKSVKEGYSARKSELEMLYIKAKADHKKLVEFEENYLEYQTKLTEQRNRTYRKLQARERLHAQAKNLIASIRNESIKKHAESIQNSYFRQFQNLKNEHTALINPITAELSISADWFNAMKVAYALEQNRILEREIENEMRNGEVNLAKVKELNSEGKRLVTKMLTPAD